MWAFGLVSVLTLGTAVTSCVVTEHVLCRVTGRDTTVRDWSVVITGVLYGLTLPPGLALWMVAAGGVIAIGLGKFAFGGLGYNPFNPALVGRAVLQAAFPVSMTTWSAAFAPGRFTAVPSSTFAFPFASPTYDAVSGATPLAAWKFEQQTTATTDLLAGYTSGSTGETCAVLILLGGAYLVWRGMMSWRIPVAIFAAVVVVTFVLHSFDAERYASPQFMLLSGGLMLGATFMATDMVASPMTHLGCVVYGVLIGVLVVVIRTWGGMPEGMMYAILLGKRCVAAHRPDDSAKGVRHGSAEVRGMTGSAPATPAPERQGVWPMYRALVGVGLACALCIVAVFAATEPIIRRNKIEARQRAVFEVLPLAVSSAAFRLSEAGRFEPVSEDSEGEDLVFVGYDESKRLVGVAIEARGMGYQDVIRVLYGYAVERQAVVGMRVLESRETPGLGDGIETNAVFLQNFEQLDVALDAAGSALLHSIAFVKPGPNKAGWEIDGITGATISSRAIANMLSESAAWWIPRIASHVRELEHER